jgi:hypothetical protein
LPVIADVPPGALNLTEPLLWIKAPLVKSAFPLNSSIPLVEVNAVPLKVKSPLMVIPALPPVNIPSEKEASLVTRMVLLPCMIVPVYPPVTVILRILTGISIVQLPTNALSNVTLSPAVGVLKPPGPPDLFDQLAVLFQFEAAEEIQNRFAAWMVSAGNNANPSNSSGKANFMNIELF